MLNSVALRAQISSIIDALSKAAVAEIVKVFEDGMVVMRLQVCQRDIEIKKLKTNLEVLHNELRTVQSRVTLHADTGRDGEICSYVAQTENCCNTLSPCEGRIFSFEGLNKDRGGIILWPSILIRRIPQVLFLHAIQGLCKPSLYI